jgi:hypothetical protein
MLRKLYDMMDREKRYLLAEIMEIKGLLPLLMKPRNRQKWTEQDKRELMTHLRHVSRVSPYIAVVMLPGGFFMLPALSWWLDRRRGKRATAKTNPVD